MSAQNAEGGKDAEAETRRLLVVDDEPAILKLLKTLLTRAKYRVATCESGAEALKLLSQSQFDLMITDAIMPAMTGFDLTRAIRGNPSFGRLPILMLTRKNERGDVKKALEAGVTDYVLKPLDEHLLIDKVGLLLKNRGSEKRLRELAVHGALSAAAAEIDAFIISVRETGITVRFPFEMPEGPNIRLRTEIFAQIGIEAPIMRRVASEHAPHDVGDFPYVVELSFVGVREPELKKIRTWLQKQEILRKK